jgi:glycosyltransferase involved in cell wall biosynthesis
MRIAINLIPLQPGKNGGAEAYIRNLLDELLVIDQRNEYVLLTTPCNHDSLNNYSLRMKRRVITGIAQDITSNSFGILGRLIPKTFRGYIPLLGQKLASMSLIQSFYHRFIAGTDKPYLKSVQDIVTSENIDLLFCPFGNLEPQYLGIASVITMIDLQHEYYPDLFSPQELINRRLWYKRSCQLATKITAISDFTRDSVIEKFGIQKEKISTIYITIHPRFSSYDRSDIKKILSVHDISYPYIYYPSNTWYHKNHLLLLLAFHLFLKRTKAPYHLVFSGAAVDAHDTILAFARQLNLEAVIHHLGYVPDEDLPALYAGAEFLVFPSLFEGFGIPIIEAMAIGCPVAASNAGSLPEIGGGAAMYFDPRNPEEIEDILEQLYRDPHVRDDLRKRGHDRAVYFINNKSVYKMMEVFDQAYMEHNRNGI